MRSPQEIQETKTESRMQWGLLESALSLFIASLPVLSSYQVQNKAIRRAVPLIRAQLVLIGVDLLQDVQLAQDLSDDAAVRLRDAFNDLLVALESLVAEDILLHQVADDRADDDTRAVPVCSPGPKRENLSDFSPLNDEGHIPVTRPLPTDEKTGFKMARKELLSGDFGIFAQILAIFGVGVDTSTSYEKGSDDMLSVDRLETITFNPSESYIRDSLEADGVKIFMKAREYRKPLFIITGIKITRGASLQASRTEVVGGKVRIGFSHPGIPVEIGPDVGLRRSRQEIVAFDGSSDFVLAIRVKKIRYKKGELVSSPHYKGATMMDRKTRKAFALDLEIAGEEIEPRDVTSREDMVTIDGTSFDDDDLSAWIMPKICKPGE